MKSDLNQTVNKTTSVNPIEHTDTTRPPNLILLTELYSSVYRPNQNPHQTRCMKSSDRVEGAYNHFL